jgi:hypothetical protein
MKAQRLLVSLTVINFILLTFLLAQFGTVAAQSTSAVLRGSGLEIVDAQGRVRASISIEPPVVVDSKPYPESVLLRLSDPNGPRVKIDASSRGTGLRLADGSGIGAVDLAAKVTGASVKVTSTDGREQVLTP